MNIEFKDPWDAVDEFAASLVLELEREVTTNHPLWKKKVLAISRRTDSDDVLFTFDTDSGRSIYVVVHLTWSGEPESDSRWPEVEWYDSIEEWCQNRMLPDHEKFTAP